MKNDHNILWTLDADANTRTKTPKPFVVYINVMVVFNLAVLLLTLLLVRLRQADADDAPPFMWHCDDMAPAMCDDLVLTTGWADTGKGLPVQFFRYDHKGSTDNSRALPLLVVNGGPGVPHNYDLTIRQLACRDGHRTVIFYDQGGSGGSAMPLNATLDDFPFLLDVDYYAQIELPAVLEATGLAVTPYSLYADSWGTMIALSYAINAQEGSSNNTMVSLALAGPIPSASLLYKEMWNPKHGSIGTMPLYFKERLQKIIDNQDYESEEFTALEAALLNQVYFRSGILPDCAVESFASMNEDIFKGIEGPADYAPWTGTAKDFDVMNGLGQLSDLPIFLISGQYDLVPPSISALMHELLDTSERIVIPNSGHAVSCDAPAFLNDALHDFFTRTEQAFWDKQDFVPMNKDDGSAESSPRLRRAMVGFGFMVAITLGAVCWRYVFAPRHESRYEPL